MRRNFLPARPQHPQSPTPQPTPQCQAHRTSRPDHAAVALGAVPKVHRLQQRPIKQQIRAGQLHNRRASSIRHAAAAAATLQTAPRRRGRGRGGGPAPILAAVRRHQLLQRQIQLALCLAVGLAC